MDINTNSLGAVKEDIMSGNFPESDAPDTRKTIGWLWTQFDLVRLTNDENTAEYCLILFRFLDRIFFNIYNPLTPKFKKDEEKELLNIRKQAKDNYNQLMNNYTKARNTTNRQTLKRPPNTKDNLDYYEMKLRELTKRI